MSLVTSYVLPTHDRPGVLGATLDALARLPGHDGLVVVVDNASPPPVSLPPRLDNGLPVEIVRLAQNQAAAARNAGVGRAAQIAGRSDDHWIVMLDDDSAPMDAGFLEVLAAAPRDVGVLCAEIFLPPGPDGLVRHEAGGLPEVCIGCGAAIRAADFLALGGYDPSFDYYAEEYDLSARVLRAGLRLVHPAGFRVMHQKASAHRDVDRIIGNLVRNNAWVMARYAPDAQRDARIDAQVRRYAAIAEKEGAQRGFARGLADLRATLHAQPRTPMSVQQWERFIGLTAAREHLGGLVRSGRAQAGMPIVIEREGKNVEEVRRAALDAGLRLVAGRDEALAILAGTLSPGPMVDAECQLRGNSLGLQVWTPWRAWVAQADASSRAQAHRLVH